ncbi:hypothetical protein D3C87_1867990 [compost metagenome]
MLPSKQSFHPDKLPCRELNLRLIDKVEFVPLQRSPQIILQLQLFLRLHLHQRGVAADVHALLLGAVNGGVGVLHHLFSGFAVSGVDADPKAKRNMVLA